MQCIVVSVHFLKQLRAVAAYSRRYDVLRNHRTTSTWAQPYTPLQSRRFARSNSSMGTWAAVTKLDAAEAQPTARGLEASDISVAVVDTNAIISGLQLHRIAETAVTIPEVLSEVRDKRTRQYLANLPFALQCQQPSEESVKAGAELAFCTLLFCSQACLHVWRAQM